MRSFLYLFYFKLRSTTPNTLIYGPFVAAIWLVGLSDTQTTQNLPTQVETVQGGDAFTFDNEGDGNLHGGTFVSSLLCAWSP